jgi:integrase
VVKRALKRANIETPAKGAHLLRHTAATEMLRNGVPLDQAGLALRQAGSMWPAKFGRFQKLSTIQALLSPITSVNAIYLPSGDSLK